MQKLNYILSHRFVLDWVSRNQNQSDGSHWPITKDTGNTVHRSKFEVFNWRKAGERVRTSRDSFLVYLWLDKKVVLSRLSGRTSNARVTIGFGFTCTSDWWTNWREICFLPNRFLARFFIWVSKCNSYCITTLHDWLKNLAPLFHPISGKTICYYDNMLLFRTTSFRKIVTRDLTDSDFSVIFFSVPDVDELCLLCICFVHGRSPTEEWFKMECHQPK